MQLKLAACLATGLLISASPARATFVIETDFSDSIKMFIDVANKDVGNFQGFVGANHPILGQIIDIATVGPVDTGSGFSNIKPVKDGNLTLATFTPQSPDLFSDFSVRGQLVKAGSFSITVVDNQGNPAQTFDFDSGKSKDFERVGIVSFDGETIQSVVVGGDFKELKQIEWSGANVVGSVPEPQTWALMALGFAALGFAGYRKQRLRLAA